MSFISNVHIYSEIIIIKVYSYDHGRQRAHSDFPQLGQFRIIHREEVPLITICLITIHGICMYQVFSTSGDFYKTQELITCMAKMMSQLDYMYILCTLSFFSLGGGKVLLWGGRLGKGTRWLLCSQPPRVVWGGMLPQEIFGNFGALRSYL